MSEDKINPADYKPKPSRIPLSRMKREDFLIGKRLRPLDEAKVREYMESITVNGLLRPIGVRSVLAFDNPDSRHAERYELSFGYHCLEAALRLSESWKKGDPDRDIYFMRFPANTPDNDMKRFEIVENLHRNELSDDEKAIQTAMYAEMLKREDSVQSAKSKGAKARESAKQDHSGNSVPPVLDDKPTVTEKLAKESAISKRGV